MEKMTYSVALNIAVNCEALSCEVREKLSALLVQIDKKSKVERKPTATQKLNTSLEEIIVNSMEPNRNYTVTELIKEIPELGNLSNQKVSALVRNLKDAHRVNRTEVKGKSYFCKVDEEIA